MPRPAERRSQACETRSDRLRFSRYETGEGLPRRFPGGVVHSHHGNTAYLDALEVPTNQPPNASGGRPCLARWLGVDAGRRPAFRRSRTFGLFALRPPGWWRNRIADHATGRHSTRTAAPLATDPALSVRTCNAPTPRCGLLGAATQALASRPHLAVKPANLKPQKIIGEIPTMAACWRLGLLR